MGKCHIIINNKERQKNVLIILMTFSPPETRVEHNNILPLLYFSQFLSFLTPFSKLIIVAKKY